MDQHTLPRIHGAVVQGAYDMTAHATEEMAEDDLDINDVEASLLNGAVLREQASDRRGIRYTVYGTGADGSTTVGVVVRFAETGRLVIITVYEVTE